MMNDRDTNVPTGTTNDPTELNKIVDGVLRTRLGSGGDVADRAHVPVVLAPEAVHALARTINETAEALRWIRDYVAGLDASVAACRTRHDDEQCSLCRERGRIADDIRRLLPPVPPADEEDPACPIATSDP